MSAIVRGLRRSFRDPDGRRSPGYNPHVAAHVSERRRARQAAPQPTFRILRGKKDVTERPVPKAKTRRARFFDPDENFGKKSLVYQVKSGALQAEVKALQGKRHGEEDRGHRPDGFDIFDTSNRHDGERGLARQRDQSQSGPRRDRSLHDRAPASTARTARRGSVTGRSDRTEWDFDDRGRRDRRDRGVRDERQDTWRDDRPAERKPAFRDRDRDDYNRSPSDDTASEMPLSITYTTAASQFLYGRSVVEAALRSGRRRLYKLYVYNGPNRSTAHDGPGHGAIERLAQRKGVKVQLVDERWQRLLDKMSKGRPHNGYVLEASPLPQPPLTALGPFTEGTETAKQEGEEGGEGEGQESRKTPLSRGPGFTVEVGYQSREDASINGASNFVSTHKGGGNLDGPSHRPLVLVLDQVLDPGNLGAILRSASFLGVSAVVVSKHSSAALTAVALKASAGAAEEMALFSADAPATFLSRSREAGWAVYAAVPMPATPHGQMQAKSVLDLDGLEAADPLREKPCILVVGSEGEGLPRAIRREADVEVSIANRSGSRVVDSLNVSVAAGLLCASFLKEATRSSRPAGNSNGGEQALVEKDELNIW